MCSLQRRTRLSWVAWSGKRASGPGAAAGRRARCLDRRLEQGADLVRIASQHLGDAADVIEPQERLGDDEPAHRQPGAFVGERHGRLELADPVVPDVPHNRLAERLGLVDIDEPRPAADERVPAEPPLVDRLEQEARIAGRAQPEIRPERGEEIGVEECVLGRFRHEKRPSRVLQSGFGLSLRLASGQTQAPAPLTRHSHQEPCGEGVIATQDRRAWFNPQAMPIPALLHDLLTAAGPSGHEEPAAALWRAAASKFAEVHSDSLGNSFARVPAGGAATLAVFGHIDEVGVAVTHIDGEGMLAFAMIGTFDKEVLNGQRVVIAGREGPVAGVVVGGEKLYIDIGAVSAADAAARVAIGDAGVWQGEPIELGNHRVASRALDNRLGAYVALEAARRIAEARATKVDVVAVASVQEEQQHDGALAAVYALDPDVALAIDVTYASDVPGGDPASYGKIELGAGAMITRGTIINRRVFELLLRAAEEEQIPHAIEVFTRRTGTDADDVHKSRGGVPTGIISIPLRYMHTPGEIASLDDLEAVIALVVAFAHRLTPETSFLR